MQGRNGIFIPIELIDAFISAVILIGALFVAGCAAYYLWRGLSRLANWLRMSKVERAKAYLREHDPEFRRQEQAHSILRHGSIRPQRHLRSPPSEIFRKTKQI